MKNKKVLIIVAIVVVLLIGVGGFLLTNSKKAAQPQDESSFMDEDLPKLTPEDVGLSMTASANKKQIQFTLSKASDITGLEYELSYEADSTGGGEDGAPARITRGVAGEDTLDGSDAYESKMLDLGSCSSGTCRYDTGVTAVKLLLKVTKSDGKIYQVEDSLSLK